MITDLELGWLAGFLEGEGNFGYTTRTQNVSVRQTDEDVMIRFASILGKITRKQHTVRQIEQPQADRKTVFYVQLYGENARLVMRAIVKLMGVRRRQQIWQALNKYRMPTPTIDLMQLIRDRQQCV